MTVIVDQTREGSQALLVVLPAITDNFAVLDLGDDAEDAIALLRRCTVAEGKVDLAVNTIVVAENHDMRVQ